ncbi:MAG: hypothetical protein Q7S61_00280, partial [bacterium]|nr:hypothetical protein [bacterium]
LFSFLSLILLCLIVAVSIISSNRQTKPGDILLNKDFRQSPNIIDKVLKKQDKLKGWNIVKGAKIEQNDSGIAIVATQSAGIVQSVTVPSTNLFKITANVRVQQGGVKLIVKDKDGVLYDITESTKVNQWETLETTLYPKTSGATLPNSPKTSSGILRFIPQVAAQEKNNSYQYEISIAGSDTANSFTVEKMDFGITGIGAECHQNLSSPTLRSDGCEFYSRCDNGQSPPVCVFNPSWPQELSDNQKRQIYDAFTNKALELCWLDNSKAGSCYFRVTSISPFYDPEKDKIVKDYIYAVYPDLSDSDREEVFQTLSQPQKNDYEAFMFKLDLASIYDPVGDIKSLLSGARRAWDVIKRAPELVRNTGVLINDIVGLKQIATESRQASIISVLSDTNGQKAALAANNTIYALSIRSKLTMIGLRIGYSAPIEQLSQRLTSLFQEAITIIGQNKGNIFKTDVRVAATIKDFDKLVGKVGAHNNVEGFINYPAKKIIINPLFIVKVYNTDSLFSLQTIVHELGHLLSDASGWRKKIEYSTEISEGFTEYISAKIVLNSVVKVSYEPQTLAARNFTYTIVDRIIQNNKYPLSERASIKKWLDPFVFDWYYNNSTALEDIYRREFQGRELLNDLFNYFKNVPKIKSQNNFSFPNLARQDNILNTFNVYGYDTHDFDWPEDPPELRTALSKSADISRGLGRNEWGDAAFETLLRTSLLYEKNILTPSDISKVLDVGIKIGVDDISGLGGDYVPFSDDPSTQPSPSISPPASSPQPTAIPTPTPLPTTLSGKVYCGNEQAVVSGATVTLLKDGWNTGNEIDSVTTSLDGSFSLPFTPSGNPYQYILKAEKGSAVNIQSYQTMFIDKDTFCPTASQASSYPGYTACDKTGACTAQTTLDDNNKTMCSQHSFADTNPRELNFNKNNITFILNQCPTTGSERVNPFSPPNKAQVLLRVRNSTKGETQQDEKEVYGAYTNARPGDELVFTVYFANVSEQFGDGSNPAINSHSWLINDLKSRLVLPPSSQSKASFQTSGGINLCNRVHENIPGDGDAIGCDSTYGQGEEIRPGYENAKEFRFVVKLNSDASGDIPIYGFAQTNQDYPNPSACCGMPDSCTIAGKPKRSQEVLWGNDWNKIDWGAKTVTNCANNYMVPGEDIRWYSQTITVRLPQVATPTAISTPTITLTPTPTFLPCMTGLSYTCSSSGKSADFFWSSYQGANGYVLRLNKEPYNDWFGGGDQFIDVPSGYGYYSQVSVTPGANYEWSLQPKKSGEAYPYSGCTQKGTVLSCVAPSATLTPSVTVTVSSTPTLTPTLTVAATATPTSTPTVTPTRMPPTPTFTPTPTPNCLDSDANEPNEYLIYGQVTDKTGAKYQDICEIDQTPALGSSNYLIERTCNKNSADSVHYELAENVRFNCPAGCLSGRCKPYTTASTPSPGFTPGTTPPDGMKANDINILSWQPKKSGTERYVDLQLQICTKHQGTQTMNYYAEGQYVKNRQTPGVTYSSYPPGNWPTCEKKGFVVPMDSQWAKDRCKDTTISFNYGGSMYAGKLPAKTIAITAPLDCLVDLTGDGIVDDRDLDSLIGHFGQGAGDADLNKDGVVDIFDYSLLIEAME